MFQDGQKNILCKIASYYNMFWSEILSHIKKYFDIYRFDWYFIIFQKKYDEFPKHHAFPLCEQ